MGFPNLFGDLSPFISLLLIIQYEEQMMRGPLWLPLFSFLIVILIFGCSIRAPEVKVSGEKTTLEKQILGTYEELERDAQVIASSRLVEGEKRALISLEKKRILDALRNRRSNRADIEDLKKDGVIGEDNRGFLQIMPTDKLEKDPEYKAMVTRLVERENRDRQVIMDWIIAVNTYLKEKERDKIYAVVAKINQRKAEPGTWIQLDDGQWVKKKK